LGLTIVRLVRKYASILSNESAFTASKNDFFAAIADNRRFLFNASPVASGADSSVMPNE
jgi:hypothetical protein